MRVRTGWVVGATLLLGLVACGTDANSATTTSTKTAPTRNSTTAPTTASTTTPTTAPTTEPAPEAVAFPTEKFAAISEGPVTEELALRLQGALDEMAGEGGMSAAVMTPDGTWNGVAGTADGVRAIQVDDQFAIASVTKSIVAAQVMRLVEAGELLLDDLADEHLPGFSFDTNQATVRDLLGHSSGFRDPYQFTEGTLATDRQHVWTVSELFELIGDPLWLAGSGWEYSDANYILLGLIVEQVRGRPLAQVMRDDVLAIDGLERLVYQPDERPSEPMAMPAGEPTDALELGGGYLPSIASVTAAGPAGAMASDALSLARWWRAFCAGEIVSSDTLAEMATPVVDNELNYGLGVFDIADDPTSVGHAGVDYGFASWAGCLPEQEAVVIVLHNNLEGDAGTSMAIPLVDVLRTG